MEKEEIIKLHPSICYSCRNARKPASDENRDEGWVGCAEYIRREENHDFVIDCKEMGTGWVDLRASVFGKSSGMTTNLQLLTLETKTCRAHDKTE